MSERPRHPDRPTRVYRCPCCAQVLEIVAGSLRRVPTDPRCRNCGHNRGSHLPGFHCVAASTRPGEGCACWPYRLIEVGGRSVPHCGCSHFHDDPAIVRRAALANPGTEEGT